MLRCRLCLTEDATENFEEVKETIFEILDVLCIPTRFVSGPESVICKACNDKLLSLFQFKSNCILTEDFLYPYYTKENKICLRNILLKDKDDQSGNDNLQICRLCLNTILKSSHLFNVISKNGHQSIVDSYFSELNLDAVEDNYVCQTCDKDLASYSEFIKCILKTQEMLILEGDDTSRENTANISTENDLRSNKEEYRMKEFSIVIKEEEITLEDGHLDVETKNVTTLTSNNNRNHQRENEQQCYSCNLCSYRTKSTTNFDVHLKNHRKNPPPELMCDKCGFTTFNRFYLRNHEKKHLSLDIITCSFCDFKAPSKSLDSHIRYKHSNIITHKPKKCKICSKVFRHVKGLTIHTMLKHMNPSELEQFECYTCGYKTPIKDHLIPHVKKHLAHERKVMHKCDECNYESVDPINVRKHKQKHKKVNEEKMHKCQECGEKYTTPKSLRNHINNIHKPISDVKTYSCSDCSFKTRYLGSYSVHIIQHKDPSTLEKLECKDCSFTTVYKHKYTRHLKVYHNIQPKRHRKTQGIHKCRSCGFKTDNSKDLRRHVRVHYQGNKGPFKCETCSHKFSTQSGLNQHQTVHKSIDEVPNYKCYLCDYTTKVKGAMANHQTTHQDIDRVPNFKCTKCDFKTKYKGALSTHLKTHDKKKKKVDE